MVPREGLPFVVLNKRRTVLVNRGDVKIIPRVLSQKTRMLLGTPSFINHLNIRIMAKSALNVELYDNVLTEKKGDYTGKVSTTGSADN